MNVRNLAMLVNNEIIRGVPKIKGEDKIICGDIQVKVQHKKGSKYIIKINT